jgi:cytochrome P450 family 6
MKMMFATVLEICEEMINYLRENKAVVELEMKDILARYTTDVMGNVVFGVEVNSVRDPHSLFREMGRRVFSPPKWQIMKMIFLTTFRKFTQNFNFRFTPKEVSDFFLSSFVETINYRESNNVQRNDFFNLLLELKNHGKLKGETGEAGEKMTVNELAAQAFLFFLAGFETSSITMTFVLYELALNPDIQERLREEIKSAVARNDNQITYEAMMEMKFLQMVIDGECERHSLPTAPLRISTSTETLRKYPPVISLIRLTKEDYQIPGTELKIEKDTLVLVPVSAIHRDADIYEDPEKFDPERFSDENKASRHPMAFLAFGE